MGQDWKIINVDKMEIDGFGSKMGEFFFQDDGQALLDRLTAPVNPYDWPNLREAASIRVSSSRESPSSYAGTTLLNLPVELLRSIAEEMEDFHDLLSFAIACVRLWEVTEDVRFQYLRKQLESSSWAGTRIILLGDYARDLPPGMLTLEDKARFEEIDRDYYDSDDEDEEDLLNASIIKNRCLPLPWSGYIFEFGSKRGKPLFDEVIRRAQVPVARHWVTLETSEFILRKHPSTSREDRWMVRNLTKREFVLKSKPGTTDGIIQVLYSLIGWSNDPSISMECDDAVADSLIRGRWAGDRIDVALYSLHNAQGSENSLDWNDITNEVLDLLERLTKSEETGEEWSGEDF